MTAKMANVLSAPAEKFTSLWVATFSERATGVFSTTEENIRHVTNSLGLRLTEEQVKRASAIRWDFSKDSLQPKPLALETLQQIKEAGLKIGLISDCSCEIPGLWNGTPFAPLFDSAIFSCRVQIRKPSPDIYAIACRELGVEPTECLYVGDGGSNELRGAEDVGMTPLLLYEQHEDGEHVYRAGAEAWSGERIESLAQVLQFI